MVEQEVIPDDQQNEFPENEEEPFFVEIPNSPFEKAGPIERSQSPYGQEISSSQNRFSVGDLPRVNDRVEEMVDYVESEL